MNPGRRSAVISNFDSSSVRFAEASSRREALRFLYADPQFDLVIADMTLPDGTWCDVLRDLRNAGANTHLFVCSERQGQVLCGDIVARGGYYAVASPHDWKPPRQLVQSASGMSRHAAA